MVKKGSTISNVVQVYFQSLAINNTEASSKKALVKLQVNTGQCSISLMCKVKTGKEGNVIPVLPSSCTAFSRSIHFGDVSETNGREKPRQTGTAHVSIIISQFSESKMAGIPGLLDM